MRLRSGEVHLRRAEGRRLDEPEVDLEAVGELHPHPAFAAAEDFLDAGVGEDRGGGGGVVLGLDQDVEIADGLAAAAVAARRLPAHDRVDRVEVPPDRLQMRAGILEEEARRLRRRHVRERLA